MISYRFIPNSHPRVLINSLTLFTISSFIHTNTLLLSRTMTTHWKAVLAVTLIALTISRVNGSPAPTLQRKDLNQNLGPTGGTADSDVNTLDTTIQGLTSDLGLSSRQLLDSLSTTTDTNGLYDGLTGTRKRSPLVLGSPVSVGGDSKSAPIAKTGGVLGGSDDGDKRKRSPLLLESPVSVGGDSQSAKAIDTGSVGKKRDSITDELPLIGGGGKDGAESNILQPVTGLLGGQNGGSDSSPLSGLTSSLPIPIKRQESQALGLDGLTSGLLGGQDNLVTDLTGSLPIPIKRDESNGLGLDELTSGLLGGQDSPLSGLTSSLPIPIRRQESQGLGLDELTSGLLGGQDSPLSGLTSSLPIPIKREHEDENTNGLDLGNLSGGLTNALTKQNGALGSLEQDLPVGNPLQTLGNQVHGDTKSTSNSVGNDGNHVDGDVSKQANKLSSQLGGDLNKRMQRIKRSPLAGDLGGLTQSLPFGSVINGGNDGSTSSTDGNVTPHSVSEAPEQDLPDGRTQKTGTNVGAHVLGGSDDPSTIGVESTGKDATNNQGSSKERTGLKSSIGGEKPTKVKLDHKAKDRLEGGSEEGTDDKNTNLGLQSGGGKATDLDVKKTNTKKVNDESR